MSACERLKNVKHSTRGRPNWRARRSGAGLERGRDEHLNRKTEGRLAQNQNWYFVKWKYQKSGNVKEKGACSVSPGDQWVIPMHNDKDTKKKGYINKKLSDRILVQNPSACFTHFHFIPPKSTMRTEMTRQGQRAIAYSPILQKGELRFAGAVKGRSLLSPQPVTDMPSD